MSALAETRSVNLVDNSERSPATSHLHLPEVNISARERFGRVVVGMVAIVAGVVLLISATSLVIATLEVLLVASGLDLAITGAIGHCPLYQRLGHVPKSLGGES